MPKPSQGYGGKFGVETDRIDKVNELVFLFYISFFSVPPVSITKEK